MVDQTARRSKRRIARKAKPASVADTGAEDVPWPPPCPPPARAPGSPGARGASGSRGRGAGAAGLGRRVALRASEIRGSSTEEAELPSLPVPVASESWGLGTVDRPRACGCARGRCWETFAFGVRPAPGAAGAGAVSTVTLGTLGTLGSLAGSPASGEDIVTVTAGTAIGATSETALEATPIAVPIWVSTIPWIWLVKSAPFGGPDARAVPVQSQLARKIPARTAIFIVQSVPAIRPISARPALSVIGPSRRRS